MAPLAVLLGLVNYILPTAANRSLSAFKAITCISRPYADENDGHQSRARLFDKSILLVLCWDASRERVQPRYN